LANGTSYSLNQIKMAYGTEGSEVGFIIVWDQVVESYVGALYQDIIRPWADQTSPLRISSLLAVVAPGVPLVQGFTSQATVVPVRFAHRSPLELIGAIMIDSADRFFTARNGTLTVITATNLPPVLRTYGVGGVPLHRLEVSDQSESFTSVTITNEVGNEVTRGDPYDGGAHLPIDNASTQDPFTMGGNAQRLLDASVTQSAPGVSSFTIKPVLGQVGFDTSLALDLYDRVRVAYTRPWDGVVVTETREISGIEHEGDALSGDWLTTVRCRAPVD
jgi:hypothetical protein